MKTVGILGGMGPAATVDLFNKIVNQTPVNEEKDHLPIVIYNNPQIPSRVDAILRNGPSPLPALIQTAQELEKLNVDSIVMPCHTAHNWYEELQDAIKTPIINMVTNTYNILNKNKFYHHKKLLLLATPGTIERKIYSNQFMNSNIELITPNEIEQRTVSEVILDVKKGEQLPSKSLNRLLNILQNYEQKGVVGVIGGCTEIPLIFPYVKNSMVKIDHTLLLARRVVLEMSETNLHNQNLN